MPFTLFSFRLPAMLCASLLGCALTMSAFAADSEQVLEQPEGELPLEDLRTFTRVFEHVRRDYVEEIDDATLLKYAIRGMLSELDPHSNFLDEDAFGDLRANTSGEFGGLGIEVGMENGFVKVISPIDDTPAAKAGIEAGDLIIKLDDTPVKGLSLNEAVDLMRGVKGTDIVLTVVREQAKEPFEITITRDTITVQSVKTRVIEDHFGYLRVAQFQISTGNDLQKHVAKMLKEQPELRGFVLDLRNNPGGVLRASVDVVSTFLDGGLVVYTEGRIDNADTRYEATPGDITKGLPLVVLINDGSASASEIVAGALQDHRRGLIIGTRSFGKGSVQTVMPISEDQAVKLTTALYFTPDGRSIQAQGIEPDIIVEPAKVTALKKNLRVKEADLVGHLGNGNGGDDKPSSDDDNIENLQERDNQLYEAISLLKGLHIYSSYQQRQAERNTLPTTEKPATEASTTESSNAD